MDYGVQCNKLMYERLITGGDITLFSPSDVPGLYEAFFAGSKTSLKNFMKKQKGSTKILKSHSFYTVWYVYGRT